MERIGLRARIAALITFVVVVCVAVAFVAVYRKSSAQLIRASKEDVRQDMTTLARATVGGPQNVRALSTRVHRFFADPPFRPTSHIAFVALPGRTPLTNEPELLGLRRPEPGESSTFQNSENSAGQALTQAKEGFTTQTLPDTGRLRVLVRTTHLNGIGDVRIGIAEPVSATERATRSVRDAFLLAGALATLAALVGGMLVASRIVAPLRRMAGVAAGVDAGELDRRMNVGSRHDEVGVLAESFNHMLDRLEDAFERQNDFVADASHELRTPLTIIQGQLEVLARQPDPDPEEVQRVERLVSTEVARMERLVEDLLLLAQADTEGFLRPVEVSLPEFLDDLVHGQPAADGRELSLDQPPDVSIVADPDRLAQALRNLLNNAFAHTHRGGHVELSAEVAGDRVRFSVDDDGEGVPESERGRVFERFHRLEASRGEETGAGLGLAIVRAIAEAHGGEAYVEDSPLGGARFVIALPDTSA
jgi:two-component system OmpR family sensor kinase